jgi:hypothetical protein
VLSVLIGLKRWEQARVLLTPHARCVLQKAKPDQLLMQRRVAARACVLEALPFARVGNLQDVNSLHVLHALSVGLCEFLDTRASK